MSCVNRLLLVALLFSATNAFLTPNAIQRITYKFIAHSDFITSSNAQAFVDKLDDTTAMCANNDFTPSGGSWSTRAAVLCPAAGNGQFAQRFEFYFCLDKAISVTFHFGLDAGYGRVLVVDGVIQDVKSGEDGHAGFTYTTPVLAKGQHMFATYSAEPCCDGNYGSRSYLYADGVNTYYPNGLVKDKLDACAMPTEMCNVTPELLFGGASSDQKSCQELGFTYGIKVEGEAGANPVPSGTVSQVIAGESHDFTYMFSSPNTEGNQYKKFSFCTNFNVDAIIVKSQAIQKYDYSALDADCYCNCTDKERFLEAAVMKDISNVQACFNTPGVKGDPIYRTHDGLQFEYNGICPMVLARDCHGDSFEVVGVSTPCGLKSCLEEMRVSFADGLGGKTHVVANIGPFVRVGEQKIKRTDLVDQVMKIPGGELSAKRIPANDVQVTLTTDVGVKLVFDGFHFGTSTILLSKEAQEKTCGMLGSNKNGKMLDDLRKKDGTQLAVEGKVVNNVLKDEETILAWASEWMVAEGKSEKECRHRRVADVVSDNCGSHYMKERVDNMCQRLVSTMGYKWCDNVPRRELLERCVQHTCSCFRMPDVFKCASWATRELLDECHKEEQANGFVF